MATRPEIGEATADQDRAGERLGHFLEPGDLVDGGAGDGNANGFFHRGVYLVAGGIV